MNFNKIKSAAINKSMKFINERRGWTTDRKIIVIESDDWGSIRMPNRYVYNNLLKSGIRVDKCHYCKYDSLASKTDLEHLYSILIKYKDKNGNHPIITANTIVANPDFKKIEESNFESYFYETFLKTIETYPNHNFDLWKEGVENKIFYPQSHGREHLNIHRWMKALQFNSKEVHLGFKNNFFGLSTSISKEKNPSFMAALDSADENFINEVLIDGLVIFEDIFKYKSESFIAPNYIWSKANELALKKRGVNYLQGTFVQKLPSKRKIYHYLGEKNKTSHIYLTRNAFFEPSELKTKDWVNNCLKDVDKAFNLNKPAIIGSHRVNYIGEIFEENRMKNLKLLDELLFNIIKKWPNVEFMTSDKLGKIITS